MLLTEDYQAMNLTFTESRIDESSTSKSNVISFERWQTHTHTHCGPIALPRQLKWSDKESCNLAASTGCTENCVNLVQFGAILYRTEAVGERTKCTSSYSRPVLSQSPGAAFT